MPITITMHESGQYYVSKYAGRLSNEELIPAYVTFYANNDVAAGLPELADITQADISGITPAGLIGLARWAELFHQQRGEAEKKTAIYVPSLTNDHMAHIYRVWTSGSPEVVSIFDNRDEAVRWLKEPLVTRQRASAKA